MFQTRFILGAGVSAAAMALTCASSAAPGIEGCHFGTSGAVINNDDCLNAGASGYFDPNGGCNFVGSPLQGLGLLASPSTTEIEGTTGTFIPFGGTTNTSRDLDWYTFSVDTGSLVTFTIRMNNSLGEGGAVGFDFSQCFVLEGGSCPAGATLYGANGNSCSHIIGPMVLAPGSYTFVVSVPFEVDAGTPIYGCPAAYEAVIDIVPTAFGATCSASTESCIEVHATGGCNDFACCESACNTNPACCTTAWDQSCVDHAVNVCGYFLWSCPTPGPQANDCADSATLVQIGDTVAFDNTDATTDGPNGPSSLCAGDNGMDLWYLIKAPTDGELSVLGCGLNFDSLINVYDVGTSAAFDPANLGTFPQACADDTCGVGGGPTQIVVINALADHYYAVRIGSWFDDANPPVPGSGPVSFEFAQVIFNTGPQRVITDNGVLRNLGLSSGNVAATLTKRHSAVAFTVPAADTNWKVTKIVAKGFMPGAGYAPAGCINLGWQIHNRLPGNPAPTPADQVAAGFIPTPANYDEEADGAANAAWPMSIDGPTLPPGNYYLTVYGDNGGPTMPANWAWFICSEFGIPLLEGGLHGFRSTTIGSPFAFYLLPAQFQVAPGDNPNWLYNNSFRVLGKPIVTCTQTGDQSGNGCVDGADISVILGNWNPVGGGPIGSPGDANCDGFVNGADISIVLGNWLTGPNCP